MGTAGRVISLRQTAGMSGKTPLDAIRERLQGPRRATLVTLAELVVWIDVSLQLHNMDLALRELKRSLVENETVPLWWLVPGEEPVRLGGAGSWPEQPARRMLSRGLDGGPVPQPPAQQPVGPANPPARSWALNMFESAFQPECLALTKADAAACFDWSESHGVRKPARSAEAATSSDDAAADAKKPEYGKWTEADVVDEWRRLRAGRVRNWLETLSEQSGIAKRTIQNWKTKAEKAEKAAAQAAAWPHYSQPAKKAR